MVDTTERLKINPNSKAWAILTDDEKKALAMAAMGKSTWDAGEIAKRSHYKYLEIIQRAKRFLVIFDEFAELFDIGKNDPIIPEGTSISPDFKKYIDALITRRLSISEAKQIPNNGDYRITVKRNKEIIRCMNKLETSYDNAANIQLASLIKEFDRYNNFRILPRDIQEPSGFKRRNKNRERRHLKLMMSIPLIMMDRIYDKFKADEKAKSGYTVLVHESELDGGDVVPVRITKKYLDVLTELTLFVFIKKSDAEELLEVIVDYFGKEKKTAKDGLHFWPIYRGVTRRAINYDRIQKITQARKFSDISASQADLLSYFGTRFGRKKI